VTDIGNLHYFYLKEIKFCVIQYSLKGEAPHRLNGDKPLKL